jgi:hypothetical protein
MYLGSHLGKVQSFDFRKQAKLFEYTHQSSVKALLLKDKMLYSGGWKKGDSLKKYDLHNQEIREI